MSIVSLVLVSTTYANFVTSANHSLCMLSRFWFMLLICAMINYGNAVYISLSSKNVYLIKLQAVLNAAAILAVTLQSSPISLLSAETPFIGFLFASASNSKSDPSWETVLLALLHNTSRPTCTVSPVSSIPSRLTLRSHLVVPRTRTSMTQSRSFAIVGPSNWNKIPQSLRNLFQISPDQFRKHLKPLYFSVKSRERLWFKWRYINVWLQLQLLGMTVLSRWWAAVGLN